MKKKRTCCRCPKWSHGWCAHRATMRPPSTPACDYGRYLIHNAWQADYMRKKFGHKKRRPRRHEEEDYE